LPLCYVTNITYADLRSKRKVSPQQNSADEMRR
jgi:hypothetical protein